MVLYKGVTEFRTYRYVSVQKLRAGGASEQSGAKNFVIFLYSDDIKRNNLQQVF